MTTEVHLASALDVSLENNVLNFRGREVQHGTLAAASWAAGGSSAIDTMTLVLKVVHRAVETALPEHETWLLVGSPTWQPDTRVVRHHKLWNSLKARGLEVPLPSRADETLVESEGKLRFFGAARISVFSISMVAKVLCSEPCVYVAAAPAHLEMKALTEKGWTGDLGADLGLVQSFCQSGGVLFKRYGEFDDPEKGVVAVGDPAIVKKLVRSAI